MVGGVAKREGDNEFQARTAQTTNRFCMRARDMEYLEAVTIREDGEDAVLHIGTGRVERHCSGVASYDKL